MMGAPTSSTPGTDVQINFIIESLNINTLAGKFCELQDWIETFDILCLQETKIDASFSDQRIRMIS